MRDEEGYRLGLAWVRAARAGDPEGLRALMPDGADGTAHGARLDVLAGLLLVASDLLLFYARKSGTTTEEALEHLVRGSVERQARGEG